MERCDNKISFKIPEKYEVGITITQEDIKNWIKKVNKESQCGTPVHSRWNENIWRKSYDEIVEYLTKRLNNTSLVTEYYLCLLYLEKHLPLNLRYLPWKESIQYRRAIGLNIDKNSNKIKTQLTMNKFATVKIKE